MAFEPIAPETAMGSVHLSVAELARSLRFYTDALGLRVREREDGRAELGTAARELLVLVEEPGARPAHGYTGLFHFALRLPERAELARWLAHAARERTPLQGLSDHFVSEAIYLADPDGHGIELYWDRPRERWEGQVSRMGTWPLDTRSLLGELEESAAEPFDALPEGTVMGHVHLRVAELPSAVAFYHDLVGFELMAALGGRAAFLGAGGYHHHVGVNTWESLGAPPPPPRAAALRHATIVLPSLEERERLTARLGAAGLALEPVAEGPLVRDPSGNGLVLAAA
jgi:catechol 2,3-dioxygenase